MSKNFLSAIETRRSQYAIGKEKVVSEGRVKEIVDHLVKYVPSAFNSQSARVVVLFDGASDRVWDITRAQLKKIVPPENFAPTEAKLQSFASGYGTILFFEDQGVVEGLQKQFTLFADNFPVWSLESSGMLQFAVWTALEDEGLGASLQHYNPLIDDDVRAEWNLPASWKLLGQMPFGKPGGAPGPRDFLPIEDRVKVIK